MRKYVVIVFAVLLGVIAFLMYSVRSLHQERERLENNQTALLEDVEYYKTESGNYAASVQALELTKKELSQHCQELTETIEDLNLKIKRIEAVSATATETNIPIETEVTDSIVYRVNTDRLVPVPVIRDTLMAIRYKDPWVELNGIVNRGVFKGNIHTVDTMRPRLLLPCIISRWSLPVSRIRSSCRAKERNNAVRLELANAVSRIRGIWI